MEGTTSSWEVGRGIRGFLVPLSDAAVFSTDLPHNRVNVSRIDREATPPLSPPESQADSGADPYGATKWFRELASQTRLSSKSAIFLRQSKDLDRFSLGTDLQNFFVLKSNSSKEDDVCYINIFHSHLYPDPDSFDLWLQNVSTSDHTAQRQSLTLTLLPQESVRLGPGSWTLTLGKGLEFALYIPPIAGYSQPLSRSRLTQSSGQAVVRSNSENQGGRRRTDTEPLPALSAPGAAAVSDRRKTTKPPVNPRASSKLDAGNTHEEVSGELTSLNIIGETHSSRVILGRFRGERVAIKYCRRPDVPAAAFSWRREVHALKSLKKHRNIVDILDADATKYSITMELAPGFSLDKYVNDDLWSALTEEQCGDIWLGAAEGLKWVHEKDYLHNDLKAENVMYDPGSRRTVLIDFGLAARYTPSSFRGGGTPCYVAPEYLSRQRFPVGDVWSLGVLIMFVSKLIQLPREEWELSKVFDGVTPDAQAMTDWIRRISATVKQARLPDADLLRRMVCIKHTERIASSELVSCLASTQQQAFTN